MGLRSHKNLHLILRPCSIFFLFDLVCKSLPKRKSQFVEFSHWQVQFTYHSYRNELNYKSDRLLFAGSFWWAMAVFQRSSQGKKQSENTKTIELLKIRNFEDLCYESYQYLALSSPSYQVLWDWIREAWFNWWNQAQGKQTFPIKIVWIWFLLKTFLVQQVATPSVVKRIIRLKTDSPGGKGKSCIPWPDPDHAPT